MARLATAGFEWNSADADGGQAGSGSVQSTTKRSGTYAWQGDSGAGNTALNGEWSGGGLTLSLGTAYYWRAYFRVSALPSSDVKILRITTAALILTVKLTSAGKIQLWSGDGASQIGSDSADTVSTNTWYRLELRTLIATGSIDEAELRLDGTSVASATGLALSETALSGMQFGWMDAPGANKSIYFDDFALNDTAGSFQNSWPGAGSVVLLVPTADSQVGSWTGGAGGTTNLWDALNNKPPAGHSTETNTTQIENADGSPDNTTDEYRATMTTYTAAGVGASDTVTLAQLMIWHGEDVSTGAKVGEAWIASNPAETQPADNINPFGPTGGGALGIWPTNWRLTWGGGISASGVTKGTAPIAHVRKTDTGTRVASVCALGIYVEYIPVVAATSLLLRHRFPQALLVR